LGNEGENVQKLLPEFEARHPDIKVRVQMIPWNAAHEKLLTAYAGSSLPDISQLGNTWVPEFHLLQAIENLTPWVRQSSTLKETSYFPGIWDTNIIDSSLYGVPWYVDTRVLFYRTDLLAQAGYSHPPRSWDEWLDCSRKLVRGKISEHAILFPTNNDWTPPVILGLQMGSPLLKQHNTYGSFGGSEFLAAMRVFYQFFHEGLAPIKTTQMVNIYQGMTDKLFAMHITGPWNIGEFSRRMPSELQDKWMTAPLPGPDGKIGVSLAGGSSMVMYSSSHHKAEVWKLIEYLSEPEVQKRFYRLTGDLPPRLEAWEDSSLVNNKHAAAFYEQLKHVTATPKIPEWEQIAQKVREYAELVSMDVMSIESATAALDNDVDQMLEKRRWMLNAR
jgi:multiple sugar transport system substrate-binding protein